jgi:hypothetical protein
MTHHLPPVAKLATAAALLALASPVLATEGGGGRPVTGQQVYSGAGVVAPEPGWSFSFTSINYSGDIGGSRQVPLIGAVSAGMDVKFSYNNFNLTYVWPAKAGAWNLASAVDLPVQYTDVAANLTTPRAGVSDSDHGTQFADVMVTPIIAGYHFSETDHLALSLPFYAPTGAYNVNRLANAGQNVWTVMPTVGYTHLGARSEFTAVGALEFYGRNDATDYKSGTLFRLDALWTTQVAPGWQVGAVAGWIYQVSDDEGGVADLLDGFRGRAFGLGPIATWSGKLGNKDASFSLRWVPEIEVRNRTKGSSVSLSLSIPL